MPLWVCVVVGIGMSVGGWLDGWPVCWMASWLMDIDDLRYERADFGKRGTLPWKRNVKIKRKKNQVDKPNKDRTGRQTCWLRDLDIHEHQKRHFDRRETIPPLQIQSSTFCWAHAHIKANHEENQWNMGMIKWKILQRYWNRQTEK